MALGKRPDDEAGFADDENQILVEANALIRTRNPQLEAPYSRRPGPAAEDPRVTSGPAKRRF